MSREELKKWMAGPVEEGIHDAMMEIGTLLGKRPHLLVAMAIEEFVVNFAQKLESKGKEVPQSTQIEAMAARDRARQVRLNQVKGLAYSHMQEPTDESAEELVRACQIIGVSLESIMEQISAKGHISEIIEGNGKLSNVEMFLAELVAPGKMYAASEVIRNGEQNGFPKYLINEAKRKIGIKSVKKGAIWYWYISTASKKEEQEEEVF